jgi:hypothetical protein
MERQITVESAEKRDVFAYDSLPIPKPSRLYLFWRFYALVSILTFWTCCINSMYAMLVGNSTNAIVEVGGIAVGGPAIFLIMNWFFFPWSYSVFGRYLRRSMTSQRPEQVLRGSWAVIGEMSATIPMVTWAFFQDGVGIDVALIGKAYLPAECITRIEKRWLQRYVVYHICAELRSPVIMPRDACWAMLSSLDEKHRQRLTAR